MHDVPGIYEQRSYRRTAKARAPETSLHLTPDIPSRLHGWIVWHARRDATGPAVLDATTEVGAGVTLGRKAPCAGCWIKSRPGLDGGNFHQIAGSTDSTRKRNF